MLRKKGTRDKAAGDKGIRGIVSQYLAAVGRTAFSEVCLVNAVLRTAAKYCELSI
jgi:hypothetical protein